MNFFIFVFKQIEYKFRNNIRPVQLRYLQAPMKFAAAGNRAFALVSSNAILFYHCASATVKKHAV